MMTSKTWLTLILAPVVLFSCVHNHASRHLSAREVLQYREKVMSMFYHGYDNYLYYASNYDELQPITCGGMNTWGSFSLTLIDSLDTLAIMGNYSEFRRIARYIVDNLNFNHNINVSVFETNIRVVGGLISAHLFAYKTGFQRDQTWPCDGPLLRLAESVARKLLPAFETPTGMPYGTVNLMYGVPVGETPVTCTAGVGTFLIEFASLSKLTGDPTFEMRAMRALRALHKSRSSLDLLGNHINTSDGKWTALDSSIAGGIDSFFEYLVKASMLLQNPELMEMFNIYHSAIEKFMLKEDWYLVVQMNSGHTTMPIFQSLEAFWPGLLSLMGEIGKAQKSLYNYHQVWKQYGFLPEFYDIPNYDVKRSGYPLRPEFAESVFYLYKATRDPHLRLIAVDIIESIEHSAKTECGYATVRDVKAHSIEDRMESFFLGETLKYLYLIFDEDHFMYNDGSRGHVLNHSKGTCVIDAGGYFFNTEAHPVDAAVLNCCAAPSQLDDEVYDFIASDLNRYFKSSKQHSTADKRQSKVTAEEQPHLSTESPIHDSETFFNTIILEPSTSHVAGESSPISKTEQTPMPSIDETSAEKLEIAKSTEDTLPERERLTTETAALIELPEAQISKTSTSISEAHPRIDRTESPEDVYNMLLRFLNETVRVQQKYSSDDLNNVAPNYDLLVCPALPFLDRFSRFGQVHVNP